MNRLLTSFLSVAFAATVITATATAQELSVDEAMSRMKASVIETLTSQFQADDETGEFQFVDVTINKVYDFRDYSFGAMMSDFKEYLESQVPYKTYSDGTTLKVHRGLKVDAKNARMIEYASESMKSIAGYSAMVDLTGETKFHEKKELETLFFFDWTGKAIKRYNPNKFERNKVKSILTAPMQRKIESALAKKGDQLFQPADKWLSDAISFKVKNNNYEIRYCYLLSQKTKNGHGSFCTYVFQTQKGVLISSKSLVIIEGRYEKDDNHIVFSYNDSEVDAYALPSSYDPGDFSNIEKDIVLWNVFMNPSAVENQVHSVNNNSQYECIDGSCFKMSVPFYDGGPVVFKKEMSSARIYLP